jgi:hypothetical protein
MRTNEVTCNILHVDYPDDIIFTVRELLVHECQEVLTVSEEDPVGETLRLVIDGANLELREQIEIVQRGTLTPLLDHAAAIMIARHSRAALQSLSDAILELTSQAIGFESVAGLHTVH